MSILTIVTILSTTCYVIELLIVELHFLLVLFCFHNCNV